MSVDTVIFQSAAFGGCALFLLSSATRQFYFVMSCFGLRSFRPKCGSMVLSAGRHRTGLEGLRMFLP